MRELILTLLALVAALSGNPLAYVYALPCIMLAVALAKTLKAKIVKELAVFAVEALTVAGIAELYSNPMLRCFLSISFAVILVYSLHARLREIK